MIVCQFLKDMLRYVCMCMCLKLTVLLCMRGRHLFLCGIYKTKINSGWVVKINKMLLCQEGKKKECSRPQDIDNNICHYRLHILFD